MEKKPKKQEKLDLSIYADEIIENCREALLILADEENPDERPAQKRREERDSKEP